MQRLGLLYHPHKERAHELALEWREEILARGAPPPLVESAWEEEGVSRVCGEVDLILTLGGDGTLLRVCSPCGNLWRSDAWRQAGTRRVSFGVAPGKRAKQTGPALARRLLDRRTDDGARALAEIWKREGERYDAINDVVVSRGKLARVIRIEAAIDGEILAQFALDGAIVATATGSTAYSLAAGGPILAPTVRTMLLTLISPYLSPIHSLVLPEGARVSLKVNTNYAPILTIDGQVDIELRDGDVVETAASPIPARFARLGGEDLFLSLAFESPKGKRFGIEGALSVSLSEFGFNQELHCRHLSLENITTRAVDPCNARCPIHRQCVCVCRGLATLCSKRTNRWIVRLDGCSAAHGCGSWGVLVGRHGAGTIERELKVLEWSSFEHAYCDSVRGFHRARNSDGAPRVDARICRRSESYRLLLFSEFATLAGPSLDN